MFSMSKLWPYLPVLWIKILWSISPTLVSLSLPSIRRYGALVLSGIFLISMVSIFFITQTSPSHKIALLQAQFQTSPPPQPSVVSNPSDEWKALYQLQPRHRDVLLNLGRSLINQGQVVEGQVYLDTAKKLDPNFNFSVNP